MQFSGWLKGSLNALGIKLHRSSCRQSLLRRRSSFSTAQIENLEPRLVLAANASLSSSGILTVTGTEGTDKITISQTAGGVIRVRNMATNTLLPYGNGTVTKIVVNALGGADTIDARGASVDGGAVSKSVTIDGGLGNDTLYGGSGNDLIKGQSDNDSIISGLGKDSVSGGDGNDTLDGGDNDDSINGGNGNDLLAGGGGHDTLVGQIGTDSLNGGDGNDSLDGGDGSDLVFGDAGADTLVGGIGLDTLNGGVGNDLLKGGGDNDKLFGGTGKDTLYGEDGYDTLHGEEGMDTLFGGNGNDGLIGGDGNDSLVGGAGADRFLVQDVPTEGFIFTSVVDRISDAKSEDAIITFMDTDSRSWLPQEIQTVDLGLAWLHKVTNNTRLLKTADGKNLTIERMDVIEGTVAGRNERDRTHKSHSGAVWSDHDRIASGLIRLSDFAFDGAADQVFVHEVGHNWDTEHENSTVGTFRNLSGWIEVPDSDVISGAGTVALPDPRLVDRVKAEDGDWYYYTDAKFSSPEAHYKENPREDFAASFADRYRHSHKADSDAPAKWDYINTFIVSKKS